MMEDPSSENWLRAERISCPQCREPLFRVDHSPFYDCYFFYCEQCANRVEVSFYDPIYETLSKQITEQKGTTLALMRATEQHLRLCDCGGCFRHDASRRCHRCLAEVLINSPEVDLWPGYYDVDVDERDPTDEETSLVEEFETDHLRRNDVWQVS